MPATVTIKANGGINDARDQRSGRPEREAVRAPSSGRHAEKLSVTARSFAILEHVARSRAPIDVLDIMNALALPKATAYRLVDWFVCQGYLRREAGRKRLIVGPKLTNLAFGVLGATMENAAAHVVLQRLVQTAGETCNIGTLINGEVVYLDRVEADHWPLRLHFAPGARVPLHCTAIGKLFLALAPTLRRRRVLQHIELKAHTEHTIVRLDALEAELRQIRKEQVSLDREEFLLGVVCAAVPIIGRNGEILAALAIQAPQARMGVGEARTHLPALRRAARDLAEIFQSKD
jgi:DNA-binding IclR family transcriptional regulator